MTELWKPPNREWAFLALTHTAAKQIRQWGHLAVQPLGHPNGTLRALGIDPWALPAECQSSARAWAADLWHDWPVWLAEHIKQTAKEGPTLPEPVPDPIGNGDLSWLYNYHLRQAALHCPSATDAVVLCTLRNNIKNT
jgi:hypothetical protein